MSVLTCDMMKPETCHQLTLPATNYHHIPSTSTHTHAWTHTEEEGGGEEGEEGREGEEGGEEGEEGREGWEEGRAFVLTPLACIVIVF